MKSSAKKVELAPYDDLFSTEESRQDAKLEKIQEIPLSELHPFKGASLQSPRMDEAMMEDRRQRSGSMVFWFRRSPARTRRAAMSWLPVTGGTGPVSWPRKKPCLSLSETWDDDAATIIMVDSNLQRESLLPSERAFAYKMKLEAMKTPRRTGGT